MSTTPGPGARAVSSYEIADVFLIESHCSVDREFAQTQQFPEVIYGHHAGLDPEVLMQTRTVAGTGAPIYVVRYFIKATVQLLKPGIQLVDGQEPEEQDFISTIRLVFAADYTCPADAFTDKDAISAFGRNAFFHAWPHVREEVHAACSRLRIPRITLPMLKPGQLAIWEAKESKEARPRKA